MPSVTASVTGAAFGVVLVADEGSGHGALPASAFRPTVTGSCTHCWLGVVFIPKSAGTTLSGLSLTSVAGGLPENLALVGMGAPLTGLVLTPATPDFGTVPLGSRSAPVLFTLVNLSSPATAVIIQDVSVSGDFELVANTTVGTPCQGTLPSGAACFLAVRFVPGTTGVRSGMLTVTTGTGSVAAPLMASAAEDPGIGLSPTTLNFSNVSPVNTTSFPVQQRLTLTNTGAAPLAIGAPFATSSSFTPSSTCGTLDPGATCTMAVQFAPGTGNLDATLHIPATVSRYGQPYMMDVPVPLHATYTMGDAGLALLPSQADFGSLDIGTLGQTRLFTLTNLRSTAQNISLSVPQQFPLAAPPSCTPLAAGASCTFAVTFLPETGGTATGSLIATASGTGGQTAQAIGYLQGYGQGSGTLAISGLFVPDTPTDFGSVVSGQTAQRTLVFTNTGTGTLTLRRLVSTPPFRASTDCGQTLTPGQTCSATVTYARS